jgi:uncharacterized protein (DUF1810 family)
MDSGEQAAIGRKPMENHGDEIDPFHLNRFVEAQNSCFEQVLSELVEGQKRTHWMWFIFPQIHGLGSSATAQLFAITGFEEACAYLNHPLLGARLRDCTELVNAVSANDPDDIFGYPDSLKFHSSMTLFATAMLHDSVAYDAGNQVFADALIQYFHGEPDQATLDQLQAQ